MSIYNHLLH